jgi:TonB-linked SusC/RagA family outer membrane protein
MNKLLPIACFFLFNLQFSLTAQTITGTVLDENKQPMIGAAARLQGTTAGTTTNMDGKFSLKSTKAGKVVLEFSFVGYEREYRTVNLAEGQTVDLKVNMKPNANSLNEMVVVGYGVQRKRDVTGSIVSIEGKELTEIPTPSFENGLQGKASGLQVITGSGAAGSASTVRIRGVASASAGGDPLYVIDGIPITQDYFLNGNAGGQNNNPLATINPNDIENVEILKDAASTGIYGSRGSNGVILITTKRGKKKGFHASFSTRQGVSTPTARPNMMDTPQYLQMLEEAWVNDGRTGTPTLPGNISWADARKTNTDWVDEVIGVGYQSNYDLGVSNSTDKYNVYFGLSKSNDNSYMIGNAYGRTAGRVNADFNVTKNFKASFSSSLSQGVTDRLGMGYAGGLGSAMSTSLPIYPVYHEKDVLDDDGNVIHKKGDFFLPSNDINRNPVASRELKEWQSKESRSINNIALEFNPIKNLYFKGTGSLDYMAWRENEYQKQGYDVNNPTFSKAYRRGFDVANYNLNLVGNYILSLEETHNFNFMLGMEYQDSRNTNFASRRNENDATGFLSDDDPNSISDNNSRKEAWNFVSHFGRVNYNYKHKYLAEVVARRDGSSRFGRNNKYGFFPSASVGWILSEEDFLKDSKFVSFLKVKTSYGVNGNSNIPSYAQYNIFFSSSNAGGYNGQTITYPDANNPANPNLQWETSQTADAALEFGFFKDRLTGEVAYYNKNTDNMLLNVSSQLNTGFSKAWANVGKVNNQGVELTLKVRAIDRKFKWNVEFNIARNRNEVTSLGGFTEDAISGGTNDTRLVVGQPIGNNYLVRFDRVDPANGKPIYLDKDGKETYTWDVNNRVSTGAILPDAFGGFKNEFRYGAFDLSVFWVFVLGGDIFDSSSKRQLGTYDSDGWNHRTDQFDRWTKPGDIARYPVLSTTPTTYGSGTPWINTTLWLQDGTYARLRNLSLGIQLPESLLKKAKLSKGRVAIVGTNLFTLTKFRGLDPEVSRDFENATDRNMSPNITYLTAPQQKTISISLEIGF